MLVAMMPSQFMWTTPDAPERCTIITAADEFGRIDGVQPASRALAPVWAMYPQTYRFTYERRPGHRTTEGRLSRASDDMPIVRPGTM